VEEAKLVLKVVLDEAVKELQRLTKTLKDVQTASDEVGNKMQQSLSGASMMDAWTKKLIEETGAVQKLIDAETELLKLRQKQPQEYQKQLAEVRKLRKELAELEKIREKDKEAPEGPLVAKEKELNIAKQLLQNIKVKQKLERQAAQENIANVKKSIAEQIKYSGVIGQQIKLVEELRVKWRYATSQADLKKYGQQLQDAEKKLAQLKATGEGAFKSIGRGAGIATSIVASLRGMMVRFISVYAIIGTFKNVVQTITEFEQGMKELQAITNATTEDMIRLESQAIRLAGAYRFSAKAITELYLQLGRLGFTTKEIEASTEALLRLSTATGEDLASAAQIAASVIRGLNKDASELNHIVDVMGVGFNTSALDLARFRESVKYILPIANQLGISFEMLTALLGKLADAQIYGSLAGSSLRNLFAELAEPTSMLTKLIGFQVDSDEDLIEALDILNKRGLELADIFKLVEKRATTTLTVLIENSDGMKEYYDQMLAANGEMQRMADKVMESLQSQMKATKNEWQALILSLDSGSGMFGRFWRDFLAGFKDVAIVFNKEKTSLDALLKNYELFNTYLEDGSGRLDILIEKYKRLKPQADANYLANKELSNVIAEIVKLLPEAASGYDAYGNALDINLENVTNATKANKEFLESLSTGVVEKLFKETAKTSVKIGELKNRYERLNEQILEQEKLVERTTNLELKKARAAYLVELKDKQEKLNATIKVQQIQLQENIVELKKFGVEYDSLVERLKNLPISKLLTEAQQKVSEIIKEKLIKEVEIQVNITTKTEEIEEQKEKIKTEFAELKKTLIGYGQEETEAAVNAYKTIEEKLEKEYESAVQHAQDLKDEYNKIFGQPQQVIPGTPFEQIGTGVQKPTFYDPLLLSKEAKFADSWRQEELLKQQRYADNMVEIAKVGLDQLRQEYTDFYNDEELLSEEEQAKKLSLRKKAIDVYYDILMSENKLQRDSLKKRERTVSLAIQKEIAILEAERDLTVGLSEEEMSQYNQLIAQKSRELAFALRDEKTKWNAELLALDKQLSLEQLKNQIQTNALQLQILKEGYNQELAALDEKYALRTESDDAYKKEKDILDEKYRKKELDLEREHATKLRNLQSDRDKITLEPMADSLQKELSLLKIEYDKQISALENSLQEGNITLEEYLSKKYNLYLQNLSDTYKLQIEWYNKEYELEKSHRDRLMQIQQTWVDASGKEGEDAEKEKLKIKIKGTEDQLKADKDQYDRLLQQQAMYEMGQAGYFDFKQIPAVDPGEMEKWADAVAQGEANLAALKLQLAQLNQLSNIWEFLNIPSSLWDDLNNLYDEFTNFLEGIFDKQVEYADRQVELYDQMIEEKQREVETEAELMAEGYANMKSIREAELADLRVKREEAYKIQQQALKRQEALEKTIQAVNMVTAITEVIKGAAKEAAITMQPWLAPVIAAGVTAALFGILRQFSSQAKSIQYGEGGSYVIEGKRHTQGGEVIREGEQGERVSVFSRKATAKYGDFIQSLTQSLNQDHPQEVIPSLAKSNFVGDSLEFPIKTNIEKFKEITQRREEVKRLDVKVSLDESSELRNIRKLLDTRLDEQYIETVEYIIYKKGNLTRRIRK
jgi:TP901 family phage tail tape measure protein